MKNELLKFEDLAPTFAAFDLSLLHRLFRVNVNGKRIYGINDKYYLSLTSWLDAVATNHERKFLESWKKSMRSELGTDEQVVSFVQSTADYGTLLHIILGDFAKNRKIDWMQLQDYVYEELKFKYNFPDNTVIIACREIIKDTAALVQFFNEHDAEIMAVELPVFNDRLRLATQIDFVVKIGNDIWVINLKSGKNSGSDDHVLQLMAERDMFNELYGSMFGMATKIANLHPTDWRKTPKYNFKDQTKRGEELKKVFELKHQLALELGVLNAKSELIYFEGITEYGQSPVENMKSKIYEY